MKPRLVFGDTETTGLCGNPSSLDEALRLDRQIIEYAFAVWEDGAILKRFERKVMPTGYALADAEHCASNGWNHFKASDWMNPTGQPRSYTHAVPWSGDDCQHTADYLTGETLAGSNPSFDLVMFKAEFQRLGFLDDFPKLATHRMCDVGALAWPLWAFQLTERTGLEPLTKLLGIPHEAHKAMGDVLASVAVFEALCDQYVGKPRQLRDLLVELAEDADDQSTADVVFRELETIGVVL